MLNRFAMKGTELRRTMVGIAMALMSSASSGIAKERVGEASCVVQRGPKGLDVRCPNASVAQLLGAFKKATGLRSEYPDQLASVRVSTMLRGVQLHDALRSAFAEFNIAIWEDQSSPSATWLRLVGLRGTVGGAQQAQTYQTLPTTDTQVVAAAVEVSRRDRTHQTLPLSNPEAVVVAGGVNRQEQTYQRATTNPEMVPRVAVVNTSAASLFPPENKAEMELARETFAQSVGQGVPLAPPPVGGAGVSPGTRP